MCYTAKYDYVDNNVLVYVQKYVIFGFASGGRKDSRNLVLCSCICFVYTIFLGGWAIGTIEEDFSEYGKVVYVSHMQTFIIGSRNWRNRKQRIWLLHELDDIFLCLLFIPLYY